jgi:hemoglobin
MTETTPYARLGGDQAVRALVDAFYDHMDEDGVYPELRALHAKSLANARRRLYMFLSGWLGGPALYIEKYGHPRLRARHLPFSIGALERDQWLACMARALDDQAVAGELRAMLDAQFAHVADFMRNRPEPENAADRQGLLTRLLKRH